MPSAPLRMRGRHKDVFLPQIFLQSTIHVCQGIDGYMDFMWLPTWVRAYLVKILLAYATRPGKVIRPDADDLPYIVWAIIYTQYQGMVPTSV